MLINPFFSPPFEIETIKVNVAEAFLWVRVALMWREGWTWILWGWIIKAYLRHLSIDVPTDCFSSQLVLLTHPRFTGSLNHYCLIVCVCVFCVCVNESSMNDRYKESNNVTEGSCLPRHKQFLSLRMSFHKGTHTHTRTWASAHPNTPTCDTIRTHGGVSVRGDEPLHALPWRTARCYPEAFFPVMNRSY